MWYDEYCSVCSCRHLVSQLKKLPMLIIAVVAEGSGDSHVTKEGQQLAKQSGASFLATNSPEWGSEWLYMCRKTATLRDFLSHIHTHAHTHICTHTHTLPTVGCTSDFFSKCWYSRFTSWQIQNYNPRGNKDRFVMMQSPLTNRH